MSFRDDAFLKIVDELQPFSNYIDLFELRILFRDTPARILMQRLVPKKFSDIIRRPLRVKLGAGSHRRQMLLHIDPGQIVHDNGNGMGGGLVKR